MVFRTGNRKGMLLIYCENRVSWKECWKERGLDGYFMLWVSCRWNCDV